MVLLKTLSNEKFEKLRKGLEGDNFLFKENNIIARIKINSIVVYYIGHGNNDRILDYNPNIGALRIDDKTIDSLPNDVKLKVRSELSKVGIKE